MADDTSAPVIPLFPGALSAGSAIPGAVGMNQKGENPEFLPISEAVACLEAGMYGNFNQPEEVKEARKHYPGASIGFGRWKEHAARIIDNALMDGELSVLVLPDSTEGEVLGAPLQVPQDVLGKMIRTRDGLPDRVIQPMRIFAKDSITPELFAALLLKSKLHLRRKEFDDWKRNWPFPAPPNSSDRRLKGSPRCDHDVPLDATLETDFTWNVGTKRADFQTVASLRRHLAPVLLTTAALALSAVGITINGWFARSLGSSDVAGWLFLAVGVAADLVALVMPACAAGLWQAGQRATALVAWIVWLMTFVFAVTAGIGFASTNIADVTLSRASRITPAVTNAQAQLADAMAARDRECNGGVGKFCREREAMVAQRRQVLDAAMAAVGQTADPQTEAAIKLVAWVSRGLLRPAADDFAMLRLILLALLPQIGGILLMVGRRQSASD